MIDIHTHILPGVDDGSENFEESIEMLKIQLASGITKVVLTPHINSLASKVSSSVIEDKFYEFKEAAEKLVPEVELFFGAEIRYRANKDIDYERFAFRGFDKKYVLIEFAVHNAEPAVDVLYNLVTKGYQPILAHAERYSYLSVNDIRRIKLDGTLIQVNASAVLGLEGKKLKRRALNFIKLGLVDIMASDTHNTNHRKPNLVEGLKRVSKIFEMKGFGGK